MDPTTSDRAKRLLITGASGYIGGRLLRAARARGFEVVAAVRPPRRLSPGAARSTAAFDLAGDGELDPALHGIDGVIHLAAILGGNHRPAGGGEDLNVSGTRRLLDAARRQGVRRFVFVSSQSAAEDSPTDYGRSKWEIERLLTCAGECAVRTGLVSGGPPRGLYGVLFRLAKRLPALPVVRPQAPVHPVHVDDVCAGLLSLMESGPEPPKLVRLGSASPMRFGDYVRRLARCRLGKRVRLLTIPTSLILLMSRLTEAVPFLPTVSSERVRGLMALRPMDPEAIPAPPAAPPLRDVFEVLEHEGRRRRLLAEGRALMAYVLGAPPPSGAVRRYVRAVHTEADPAPLDLAGAIQAWPRLMRLAEPLFAPPADRWRRRLTLATRIVEMTPEAAPVFHAYRARPRVVAWFALAWTVGLEAVFFPFRLLLALFRR